MHHRRTWLVVAVAAAALGAIAIGADQDGGGDAPYSPTRGEWLCVWLNVEQAVTDGAQFASSGIGARFRYDRAQPDTIQIEVLYPVRAPKKAVRYRAQHAEMQARQMALAKGWDGWLKTEIIETKIPQPLH